MKKTLKKLDYKLVLFFIFFVLLGYALLNWFRIVVFLYDYLLFNPLVFPMSIILLFSLLFILMFAMVVFAPISDYLFNRYLSQFKQNASAHTVIILGYPDWLRLKGWYKKNFTILEIRSIVKYLAKKGDCFSVYPRASREDVEKIMSDKTIKEVYFCGHGDSHSFRLNSNEIIYYCDFSDPIKYEKEFVHQVHYGTSYGKSLISYIVPQKNQNQCFFFPKTISPIRIIREFNKRRKNIPK